MTVTGDRVLVVGVGRIGAVTAVGLAHLLHDVTGVDTDAERVTALRQGRLPEAEPGLRAALRSALRLRQLRFERTVAPGHFDIAVICVDTPPLEGGEPDLRQLMAAGEFAARVTGRGGVVVTRSTVPPGTGDRLEAALRAAGRGDLRVVHVPEFLREGRAWEDFREPDRVVIGANDDRAGERAARLFDGLDAPVLRMDRVTAELAKYAANAFLATSVSFANEMADLSAALGADPERLFEVLKADRRIGQRAYLVPGLGFGGHCLPKDAAALEYVAATLGLAFKPGTDDLRASPALALADLLRQRGAIVRGFDPLVREAPGVQVGGSAAEALEGADGVVVAHRADWVRALEPALAARLMRGRVVFDAPGAIDHAAWAAAGFATNRCSMVATGAADR
jgi:UDPglucose 6-dehydrogenase